MRTPVKMIQQDSRPRRFRTDRERRRAPSLAAIARAAANPFDAALRAARLPPPR